MPWPLDAAVASLWLYGSQRAAGRTLLGESDYMFRMIAMTVILGLAVSVAPAFAAGDRDEATDPGTGAVRMTSSKLVWGEGTAATVRSRPAALPALYAGYAALQAFDVYSTRRAIGRGAREVNPLMQGVVGNTGALVALKAGVGVSTIVAAERLWKTNKTAAVAVMVASNTVSAIVAARNVRTLR
jgi:uncharacterized protein DUF5658